MLQAVDEIQLTSAPLSTSIRISKPPTFAVISTVSVAKGVTTRWRIGDARSCCESLKSSSEKSVWVETEVVVEDHFVCVKAFCRPVQHGAWLTVHLTGASDNRTTGGCPAAPASTLLASCKRDAMRIHQHRGPEQSGMCSTAGRSCGHSWTSLAGAYLHGTSILKRYVQASRRHNRFA